MALTPASDREVEITDNTALVTTDYLSVNHHSLESATADIEALVSALPASINDDAIYGQWQDRVAKEVTPHLKAIEATRVATKQPFLHGGAVVDSYFHKLNQRAAFVRVQITNRLEAHLTRKRNAERARLEAEAKKQREEQEKQRRLAQEAQDKAEAAKRASTKEKAEQASREAEQAARDAAAAAEDYAKQANAKSADLSRTRSSGGSLGSLKDTWEFTVTEIDAVKGSPLWPFIDRAAKEKAIRAYIKANAPKDLPPDQEWQPLTGVHVYRKSSIQVR